jgi:hypothetical protein
LVMGQGRSSSESQVNPRRWAATWTCFIVKVMPGSFENNTEVATDHISPVLPQQLWLYWAHLLPTLSMWVFCRAEGRDKEEEAALPLMLSCGLTWLNRAAHSTRAGSCDPSYGSQRSTWSVGTFYKAEE